MGNNKPEVKPEEKIRVVKLAEKVVIINKGTKGLPPTKEK